MSRFLILSKQIGLLLFILALVSSIHYSHAASSSNQFNEDSNIANDDEAYQQRRTYDVKKLRHFLLTSNAEQRAAKREQQNFYKQQLIREYLRSMDDSNSERLQEIKKRIKTFCNSYEDVLHSDRATCG